MTLLDNHECLCGSHQQYLDCCGALHLGKKHAATPEQLMRSRYVAYALKNADYIYQTYAKNKRAANPIKEIAEFANNCRFSQLEIITTSYDEQHGLVEFCANYFYQNLYCQLHEKSSFIKEDGKWRYTDGEIYPVDDIKVGRNDECPCLSGKKYKKCHSL